MSTGVSTHNVVRYLEARAYEHPDRVALVEAGEDGDESWSFGELKARADWMAAGLRAEGVGAGDRVIIMVPMSLRLYQVLLGVLEIGAVAVFADPWVGVRGLAAFSSYAEPVGFVGVGKSHVVRLFDGSLRTLPVTVTTGSRLWCIPARQCWEEVLRYEGPVELFDNEPDDTALITFTSGSSGEPKGANRTHNFLSAQHEALNAEFPYGNDDVDMPTFPVFSLNNLANGVTTVIPQIDFRRVADAEGAAILRQMKRYEVTTSTGSPPFFDRLCDALEESGEHLSLRRVLTGGAPVSDAQLRRWRRLMPDTQIIVIYGSTEAEPVAHIEAEERLRLSDDDERPGFCVGSPVGAVEARVIEITHEPVELDEGGWSALEVDPGEIGELVVCGEHVCEGYFRNPAATAENKIADGNGTLWHRMGDTGYFDDEGRFWLTGRVHSTIVRDGRAIQAQVVEQLAMRDGEHFEKVAAVGVPDEELGERLVLVAEVADNTDVNVLTEDVLVDQVRRRVEVAGYPVDEVVLRREAIPVDPRHNSKIDYGALRGEL